MMRARSLASMLLFVGISAIACQRDGTNPSIAKTDDEVKKTKPPKPDLKRAEPSRHRAESAPCPKVTKTATFKPRALTPPGRPCKSNSDCTEKPNGRCSAGSTCTYDSCYVDADCRPTGKSGGVCVCDEEGARGYSCLPGDCSVDADCGGGGYCSPTYGMQCGPFTGTIGWYCHTPKDTCTSDGDCKKEEQQGYCAFNKELGFWSCGYGICEG